MSQGQRSPHFEPADDVVFAAGIAISVLIVQNFLREPVTIEAQQRSVFAFAIAIPLLGVGAFFNHARGAPREQDPWWTYMIPYVGLVAAGVGVFFAFDSLLPSAGVAFAVCSVIAAVAAIYYTGKYSTPNEPGELERRESGGGDPKTDL